LCIISINKPTEAQTLDFYTFITSRSNQMTLTSIKLFFFSYCCCIYQLSIVMWNYNHIRCFFDKILWKNIQWHNFLKSWRPFLNGWKNIFWHISKNYNSWFLVDHLILHRKNGIRNCYTDGRGPPKIITWNHWAIGAAF